MEVKLWTIYIAVTGVLLHVKQGIVAICLDLTDIAIAYGISITRTSRDNSFFKPLVIHSENYNSGSSVGSGKTTVRYKLCELFMS